MNNSIIKNVNPDQLSPCSKCLNKFKDKSGCKAFPDKIPMEILLGKNQHRSPLSNQKNNIIFEKES